MMPPMNGTTGRRGGRAARPCGALLVVALLALPGCRGDADAPLSWSCSDHGAGRRCVAAFPTPEGPGWVCYAAPDVLACTGAGAGGGGRWDCRESAGRTVCSRPLERESLETAPDGWQCFVEGNRLVCDWRRAGNDGWNCAGKRCTERHPDRPGSGEWDCVERDDGVVCRGRFDRDLGPQWRCARVADRVLCRNLDPDFPDGGGPGAWRCLYDNSGRTGRACERVEREPGHDCGGVLVGNACLTANPAVFCYFDDECTSG